MHKTSLQSGKGGANLLSLNYSRAATGRIDAITSLGGASTDAWTYGYDDAGSLTSKTAAHASNV